MRKAILLTAMTLAVIGCSHAPAHEYQEPDEKWTAPTFPRRGASLHETLSGLYASRESDFRVVIHKIEVLRTDVTPWERVEVEDARTNAEFGEDQSFAVIAHRICTAAIEMRRWSGMNTDWFMLTKNRLSAYDYQLYSYQCLQSNLFRPARGRSIETERELQRYIEENFPKSILLSDHVYRKGIQFAKVGRVEDAELALANGDSRFDQASYHLSDRKQGSKGRSSRESDRDVARVLLVRAIQQAKDARLNPERDSLTVAEPIEADTIGELERLRQDSARRDQERRERWERERELRRFVEVEGGWMLVDEYRRKRGRAEGEVWLTYDEMKLIKAEREQERSKEPEPPPPRKKIVAKPKLAQPEPERLYVELDGEWTPVTKSQRAQGPRSGEEWVTWDEMELLKMSRELETAQRQEEMASAPPADTQPFHVMLVTEVQGKWRFVTQQERLAGPKEGEVWLTLEQMRDEMDKRAAAPVDRQ
jgi:hypothetical protein